MATRYRWRQVNPSLRRRFFLWYALTVPVLILAFGFLAQGMMVEVLSDSLDDRLQQRASTVGAAILASGTTDGAGYQELLEWLIEQRLPYVPAFVQIANEDLEVVAQYGEVPDPILDSIDDLLWLPIEDEGHFETIDSRGEESLRVYTVAVRERDTDEAVAFVQTGDSLAQVSIAQDRLWTYSLLLGLAGSGLALLVGWVLLTRGLRPLREIVSRVEDIRSGDLTVRLPEEQRPTEIQQLADGLNEMLERLEEAFQSRETFVASVSHDLRTPLTILQGQMDVLLMDPSTPPEARESLERMTREVRRLSRMTNNLLLSAQLEHSLQPEFGPVDVEDLVAEVGREAVVLGRGLRVTVSLDPGLTVQGDYDLLKQMLLNLVDNACKFTPRGGSVQLAGRRDGEAVVMSVSDTGAGISDQALPHVFEEFYKAGDSNSARRGVGLGLSIAQQIVRLYGGTIDIDSSEGQGTAVTIRLPLR